MPVRTSQYRFWLLFATLAIGVLVACSGDTTGNDAGGSSGGAADALTQS